MSPDDDLDAVDYDALHRMWPQPAKYTAQHGTWFEYVGRTRQQRDGLVPLRCSRGPRGIARTLDPYRRIVTRSTLSGEIAEAK